MGIDETAQHLKQAALKVSAAHTAICETEVSESLYLVKQFRFLVNMVQNIFIKGGGCLFIIQFLCHSLMFRV